MPKIRNIAPIPMYVLLPSRKIGGMSINKPASSQRIPATFLDFRLLPNFKSIIASYALQLFWIPIATTLSQYLLSIKRPQSDLDSMALRIPGLTNQRFDPRNVSQSHRRKSIVLFEPDRAHRAESRIESATTGRRWPRCPNA